MLSRFDNRRRLAGLLAVAVATVGVSVGPAQAQTATAGPTISYFADGLTDLRLHHEHVSYGFSPRIGTWTNVEFDDPEAQIARASVTYSDPAGSEVDRGRLVRDRYGDWTYSPGYYESVGDKHPAYGLWTVTVTATDSDGNILLTESRQVDCRDPKKAHPVHVLSLEVPKVVKRRGSIPAVMVHYKLTLDDPDHVIANGHVTDQVGKHGYMQDDFADKLRRRGDHLILSGGFPARNIVGTHHTWVDRLGLSPKMYHGFDMPRSLLKGLPTAGIHWRLRRP